MTFEEYSKTEIFRREQRRLARSKRAGYIGLALCLVGTACLVAAGFLIPDEGVTYPPWRLALLIVCTVLGLAAFGAEVFQLMELRPLPLIRSLRMIPRWCGNTCWTAE